MSAIEQTELTAQGGAGSGTAVHWIGGWWLDSGEHMESINPATGEVIGSYAMGGRKEAGIFAPWNAPLALGIRSLAPALAAGCTAAVDDIHRIPIHRDS